MVAHAGRGGDQVELVLALQPLLNDLHVEQSQESAAKAEAQRDGAFRLEEEGRIVQPQLLQSIAQQRVFVGVHGIKAGKDHGLDVFKAGKRMRGGIRVVRDGVADLGVGHVFDGGGEEADLAGNQLADLDRLGAKHAHRLDIVRDAVRHEADMLPLAHGPLHHAHQNDDAAVRVEPRVEDEGLEGRIGIAFGGRKPVHDRFQHFFHALAGLGAHGDGIGRIQPNGLLNVFLGAQDVGRGQVDLVDHGNDLEAVMDGEIGVGERLRLHALAGVDDQQRAFAGGQRPRNFVAEVHVAGRIDQVELVGVAVARFVHHAHGMGLDGDAALPLQVHIVQDLGLHFAIGHRAGQLAAADRSASTCRGRCER